jgi:hypothetical protein
MHSIKHEGSVSHHNSQIKQQSLSKASYGQLSNGQMPDNISRGLAADHLDHLHGEHHKKTIMGYLNEYITRFMMESQDS